MAKTSKRSEARENFSDIYLDLSKKPGTTRFAESGWGWKPSGGGDTFTIDKTQIVSAQWSRAARGYEVKVLTRSNEHAVIQLDGFKHEVCHIRTYAQNTY
jgi:structure-specific recognition protein 1